MYFYEIQIVCKYKVWRLLGSISNQTVFTQNFMSIYHTHFKFKTCFLCSAMRDNYIYVDNHETIYTGWIQYVKIVFYSL